MMNDDEDFTYPRKITNLAGQDRWQASDGSVYSSEEEAYNVTQNHQVIEDGAIEPRDLNSVDIDRASWSGLGLYGALACLAAYCLYALLSGQFQFESDWKVLAFSIGALAMLIYFSSAFWVSIRALSAGKAAETDVEVAATDLAWKIGCFGILAIVGLVLIFYFHSQFRDFSDDMSSGEKIIAFLLFGILVALIGKNSTKN